MAPLDKSQAVAIFAGGCFWCSESDFEKVPGVLEVVSGYTGGTQAEPSYAEVSSGASGHVEAVAVSYDPARVRYEDLLQVFWRHIDPTDEGGQFVDRGAQYRSLIFYQNEAEKTAAEASRDALVASGRYDKPLATEIVPAERFWPAEAYHQDYYKNNPLRYRYYRHRSGRDQYLDAVWGEERYYNPKLESPVYDAQTWQKPEQAKLKQQLTALQYRVTQEEGTEPPFDNPYWDEKRDGLYVDRVSGEPLFSSRHKYDSGTGWPSFSQPIDEAFVLTRSDRKLFVTRTEVRSRHADSHLGHVFADGPAPTGLRYCINSAALRFVPSEALEAEGYGDYQALFEAP